MMYPDVLSMWQITRGKFAEKVDKIAEYELSLKLDGMTIGELIYHTAEVEYMFASWFFGLEAQIDIPNNIKENKVKLVQFLQHANNHFVESMEQLDHQKWTAKVSTRMGETSPLEAVARLIYHTGIHAGQITTIQKLAAK